MAAALEICCANASLMFVTLSFYTMVKSSTPIWVLLFSFIFGFEKPRVRLVIIIGLMVTGVILTVEGETKFDMLGFLLVLIAAVISGLRWNLTQLLLQQDRLGMDNPIATLYHLSPIMFVTMFLLSLIFEDPIDQFRQSKHFDNIFHVLESFGLMSIGGFLGKLVRAMPKAICEQAGNGVGEGWTSWIVCMCVVESQEKGKNLEIMARKTKNLIFTMQCSVCHDLGRIVPDQKHKHNHTERSRCQQRNCNYNAVRTYIR